MTRLLNTRRSLACLTLSVFALGALAGCNKAPQPEVPVTPPPAPTTTTPMPSTGSTSGTMSDSSASAPASGMTSMPPASAASQ